MILTYVLKSPDDCSDNLPSMQQIYVIGTGLFFILYGGCSDSSDKAGVSGSSSSKTEETQKPETASDPVVVTGAYLTCEPVAPPSGLGSANTSSAEVGCNAMTADGAVITATQNVTMSATYNTDKGSEEKPLDFTKLPHVKFVVKREDAASGVISIKGSNRPGVEVSSLILGAITED